MLIWNYHYTIVLVAFFFQLYRTLNRCRHPSSKITIDASNYISRWQSSEKHYFKHPPIGIRCKAYRVVKERKGKMSVMATKTSIARWWCESKRARFQFGAV